MIRTVSERIVVQTTKQEKNAFAAKAKRLGLSISDLMKWGAIAYGSVAEDEDLGIMADAAMKAANRASESIDDMLEFIAASDQRIAAMEVEAIKNRKTA